MYNRKGSLILEMMTAMAILTLAIMPLLSLHMANSAYVRRLYQDAVLAEMMADRLAVLRLGGWKEHGHCNGKEIAFRGKAAESLPEGMLLLSVTDAGREPNLVQISLTWRQTAVRSAREIEKTTFVFVQPEEDE